jgi:hypothetical protein
MIERLKELRTLEELLQRHPVVGLVGARQVGKTTLARALAARTSQPVAYFDLENIADVARLADPLLALEGVAGWIVIDEVQRAPQLFATLRVLSDRRRPKRRFLVLGSASPELLQQSAETLAGRIVYHELKGFSLAEIGSQHSDRLWLRGGFPRSYLAPSHAASHEWREAFIRTFLERDLPNLGVATSPTTLRRFWTMLAHYHGQVWNASEFGRSLGVADTTVRHYLDVLTSALVIRQLPPWHANLAKRQVKSPKVYVTDSGLLHALLNLRSIRDLEGHPKVGASWEGFVIEQIIRHLGASAAECFFWATHSGAELDLLIVRGRRRLGFEVKRTSAPKITPSMRIAMSDLRLSHLDVIHAGRDTFPLTKGVRAVAVGQLIDQLAVLR